MHMLLRSATGSKVIGRARWAGFLIIILAGPGGPGQRCPGERAVRSFPPPARRGGPAPARPGVAWHHAAGPSWRGLALPLAPAGPASPAGAAGRPGRRAPRSRQAAPGCVQPAGGKSRCVHTGRYCRFARQN